MSIAPNDGFGIQGLPDRTDESQGRHVVLVDDVATGTHEEADRGRCGVPDSDVVVLNDLVPTRGAEASFVDDLRHTVRPRRHHSVRRSGDPSGIGGTEIDIVELEVEGPVAGYPLLNDRLVTVQNTFWFAC